jgi:hypothetical protein
MGSIIHRFLQSDGIVVIVAGSASDSPPEIRRGLGAVGCEGGCVLTVRRLPGAIVVGYEVGADVVTRVSAKLVGEFLEPLGRVVAGAEVVVEGRFRRPSEVVGSYFIVAVEGAEFGPYALEDDVDLVAVDLSASGIRELPESMFNNCPQLAAVAFPAELESIGQSCFFMCAALQLVDLAATQLTSLSASAFGACGLTQVSIPASLEELDATAFDSTPLKVLDLSTCTGIRIEGETDAIWEIVELRLPREGFAQVARAFFRCSRIEVIQVDVDATELDELLPELDEWGFERLRVVSSRMPPYEWRGPHESLVVPVHFNDPVTLSTAAVVTLTTWRTFAEGEAKFLRALDLSGLAVVSLPARALEDMAWLERTVLPAGLRVLPEGFFALCSRLSSIDTSGCTALESIERHGCGGCRALRMFAFPPTLRVLSSAFLCTSITEMDLSDTKAERANVTGTLLLEELVLPRRCVLEGANGVPSLRRVTLGAVDDRCLFAWQPTVVRFEDVTAHAHFSPGLACARVYAEVASEMACETVPFPPP